MSVFFLYCYYSIMALMNTTYRQNGFSVAEAILVIIFIGLLGAGGWFVYQREHPQAKAATKTSTTGQQKTATTTTKTDSYKVPDGYTQYTNRVRGFNFAYPDTFGTLTTSSDANGNSVLTSAKVTPAGGFGMTDGFVLTIYPNASAIIGSRKYGPGIQLQDKGWVIVKAGDALPGKVGDLYTVNGKAPASQQHGKLAIYTLPGGDEGLELDTYTFVARGRLVSIQLPYFVDQGYAQPTHTDKTAFNALLVNVLASIQSID
jgi:hypothetical protein